MKNEIKTKRILHNGKSEDLTLKNLEKINILFGKNGSGKSSFLRNLYQNNDSEFHLVIPERGGNIQHNSGIADQEFNPNERKNVRKHNSDNSYRERAISRTSIIPSSIGRKLMGGETPFKLDNSEIIELFSILLPEFKISFSNQSPYHLEIHKNYDNNELKVNNVDELSSGQAETISLAADIITQGVIWNNQDKTLLIDEPDAHLHLDLQNRFSIFISEISKRFNIQIIIATHSPALIASLLSLSDDIGIFCLDLFSEEINAVKKSNQTIFSNLLNIDLGLSVLLKRKIIILEGNDDYLVWNQACRCPKFDDIAIIQANGDDIMRYKRNAEKIILSVLDIDKQVGITMRDKDNNSGKNNDNSTILPLKRLQCYSLENLFLTKEVLNSIKPNIDFVSEMNKLKIKLNKKEKSELDNIINDKKVTKISKELLIKIHHKIDEHYSSRDWRIILGKYLGNNKPTGEILDFIGKDIVNYIWDKKMTIQSE